MCSKILERQRNVAVRPSDQVIWGHHVCLWSCEREGAGGLVATTSINCKRKNNKQQQKHSCKADTSTHNKYAPSLRCFQHMSKQTLKWVITWDQWVGGLVIISHHGVWHIMVQQMGEVKKSSSNSLSIILYLNNFGKWILIEFGQALKH